MATAHQLIATQRMQVTSLPYQMKNLNLISIVFVTTESNKHQRYDIIDWHLAETLVGRAPSPLILIPEEGGVGKSKTIQIITENSRSKGAGHILVKAAYTGHEQSQKTARKPAALFLARLSAYIAKGKSFSVEYDTNKPFGGVDVILSGDFHQFPPVVGGRNATLFWPCDSSKDSAEELLGRNQIGWTYCNTFVTVAVVHTTSNCSDHSSLPTHHALLLILRHRLGMKQYS